MAEEAKKDNKNLIIGICAAVVVVIVIVIAVVLGANGSTPIDDSYFVSDDTKYVSSSTFEGDEEEADEYDPITVHTVYFYSGDEITGIKTYYEYNDATTAKEAYNALKSAGEFDGMDVKLNGKYFVWTADSSEYEGLTLSEIKYLEELQDMDLDDYTE